MFRNGLIIFTANYLIIIILVLTGFFWLRQTAVVQKQLLWRAVFAFPLTLIIAKIMGVLYYNPRPFVVLHLTPLLKHTADNGFPSDHTLLSAACAALVFTVNKKWGVVLYILAFCIGLARVVALIHHWTDIFGSLIAASVVMAIVYYVEQYRKRRHLQTPSNTV